MPIPYPIVLAKTDEGTKQVFENFRYLLDQERKVVLFALWITAGLFLAIAWSHQHAPAWSKHIALGGIPTCLCAFHAAYRSCMMYRATIRVGKEELSDPAKTLFRDYSGKLYGFGSLVALAGIASAWTYVLFYFWFFSSPATRHPGPYPL